MRLGLVGCGNILRSMYAAILRTLERGLHVDSVGNVNLETARRAAVALGALRTYDDAAELLRLRNQEIDAVMVARNLAA